MPTVGLIGLGLMGGALAERLVSQRVPVVGFDINDERRAHLASLRGEPVRSVGEVFTKAQTVLLSLPDSDVVEAVIRQAAASLLGKTVIDTTTGSPDAAAGMGERLSQAGADYLDATLTGSSALARVGELVVTAGGPAEVFVRAETVFRLFAKRWFHVGSWGSGALSKLIVNLVLGLNRAALAEGLALAARSGLNLDTILEILQSGAAYSRVMDAKGRKMIDQEFTPEAKLAQHLKDVKLILQSAERSRTRLPFSSLHAMLLASLVERGFGDCDNSAIIRAFDSEGGKA